MLLFRFFPDWWQASPSPRGWPPVFFLRNEAEPSSPLAGLGLAHLLSGASSSPSPGFPQTAAFRGLHLFGSPPRIYMLKGLFSYSALLCSATIRNGRGKVIVVVHFSAKQTCQLLWLNRRARRRKSSIEYWVFLIACQNESCRSCRGN